MASSVSSYSKCVKCIKSIGTFTCRGCLEDFCMLHANEHRQMLSMKIDEDIIPLHDQLQENLIQQIKEPFNHYLIKEINQWELNSIERINKIANDIRKDLGIYIEKHLNKMKKSFEDLTEELKKRKNDEQFFENDLKDWINKLNYLQNELNTLPNVNIEYSNNNFPFLSTNDLNESFQQTIGNINIIENGSLIIHNQTNSYASVSGLNNYFKGEYQFYFKIEHLTNNWIFFGIISKDAPLSDYPAIGKTSYGWSGLNYVWTNGIRSNTLNGYISDFKTNDQIKFEINCNEKLIYLTNERTNIKYHLNVDINDCPFPWKLTIGFFHSPGECIRLLKQ